MKLGRVISFGGGQLVKAMQDRKHIFGSELNAKSDKKEIQRFVQERQGMSIFDYVFRTGFYADWDKED